jgi:two-component system, NarL family, nitrate/nitrite response regulator NarL
MNFRKPLQQVRLVIADDYLAFREGLRLLLEAEADLKVLGEASDGAEAVKLVRQLKPDILLLDLAMPKHPGLEALRELSSPANAVPVRVILLTAAIEKSQIVEALQLGARGVVLKDSATQVLLKAIQTVMTGEYWVHRESVWNLVQYLRTLTQATHDEDRQKKYGLTPRELEIVSAVVAGYSNKEIAEHFKISGDIVKHHLSNVFDRLRVSTRLQVAQWAVGVERVQRVRLTPLELEIVSAIVAGCSNKEIAEQFKISEDAVKHHLSKIFHKLGVSWRMKFQRLAVGVEHISDYVDYLRAMEATYNEARMRRVGLTSLEMEIIAKLRAGFSSLEIAEHLRISEERLNHYLKNIIDQFGGPDQGDEAGIVVNSDDRFR